MSGEVMCVGGGGGATFKLRSILAHHSVCIYCNKLSPLHTQQLVESHPLPSVLSMSPGTRAETETRVTGREGYDKDGIQGLKALGMRELSYRLAFLACYVSPTNPRVRWTRTHTHTETETLWKYGCFLVWLNGVIDMFYYFFGLFNHCGWFMQRGTFHEKITFGFLWSVFAYIFIYGTGILWKYDPFVFSILVKLISCHFSLEHL